VRNTPGVTGFIGSSGRGAKPFPLTSEEVARMILNDQTQSDSVEPLEPSKEVKPVSGNKVITSGPNATQEKVVYTADFKIGDQVVIQTGPFMNKDGKVIDMDFDKGVAIISIEMFGRYTPTEVEFKNAKILTED